MLGWRNVSFHLFRDEDFVQNGRRLRMFVMFEAWPELQGLPKKRLSFEIEINDYSKDGGPGTV